MKKPSLKIISLFSGAGGLDLGFIQAGHKVLWAIDNDKDSCETYKKNIGDHIVCEDINNTIDFACSLPLQSAQFNCFMPQPGTEIWRQFNFQDIDYHKYHVHNISYKHPYISKNDLLRLKTKAYLRFYSRPGIIFQNLKNINSLSHLYYLIKRFINSIV